VLDPKIVESLVAPVTADSGLTADEEELLQQVAEGKPIKAIAVARQTTPAAVNDDVEGLFLKLSQGASAGTAGSLKRLRMLHQAIVDREEQGETLSRLLPGGVAEIIRDEGRKIGDTEELDVTVLMADIRGYSAIAEHADPSALARQLSEHRAEMNRAIIDARGTVMQFIGDAVMASFGAPVASEDHADQAMAAAVAMLERQRALNARWVERGLAPFGLGIGLSTGRVAAALLGSEERLEYTLIGDTVNLSQRLQDLARPAGRIVLSGATYDSLSDPPSEVHELEDLHVKGREGEVRAFCIEVAGANPAGGGGD
jgi:class 3 adenylate cyclase